MVILVADSPKHGSGEIYRLLRRRVLEGGLPPATKVNIQHLATELNTSATPVREALRQLQGDGLLLATSHKGYATTDVLDRAGVKSLFEFRLLIEPWAASVAATDSLRNPARELEREIKAFNPAMDSVRHAMIYHDSRFHGRILAASENSLVIDAYEKSHCHLHLFRMIGEHWDWRASLTQHQEIQSAIARADSTGAEEAMRSHLQHAYEGFMSELEPLAESKEKLREPSSPRIISKKS
jgi:DNA-binding GntR family transcriptional regulator